MTNFEQTQLERLIKLIEQVQPFDTGIELRYCGNKGWHCDVTVGCESKIGTMLKDSARHIEVEDYIKEINS